MGVDTVVLLLLALAAGGFYQQRFCSGVDFRATAALQNAVALLPAAVLAIVMPFTVHDPWKAAGAVAAAMLFAVIPAVAGLSPRKRGSPVVADVGPTIRCRDRDRPRRRGGGLFPSSRWDPKAERAGVTPAASTFGHDADGFHHAGKLNRDDGACRLIDEFRHPTAAGTSTPGRSGQ